MQFLYPTFLWGLLAVAIPIIIHLFHFRRFRDVYFPNIQFLKEIKEETSSRSKLRNILVLLSRIFAIIALVLAFAQPYIPMGDEMQKGKRAVSLFVDNSYSMTAIGEEISLLEKAKLDAISIVEAYNNDDVFQVISNDLGYIQQQWLSKENAIEQIAEINPSHKVHPLSKILNRQKEALRNSNTTNQMIYFLSDFQEAIVDLAENQLDSSLNMHAIAYQSVQESNLTIDSCWWIAPIPVLGEKGSLIVRLKNYGNEDIDGLALNLAYNGQNYPLGKSNISAGGTTLDTLQFSLNKGGWNSAKIEMSDYPIMFDDNYWIAFEVAEKIPVLVIGENVVGKFTRPVFEAGQIFETEYVSFNRVDYTSLNKYRMILLEDMKSVSSGMLSVLEEYVHNGGNLLVFPDENALPEELNLLLAPLSGHAINQVEEGNFEAGSLNENEFVFQGVFENKDKNISLPLVRKRFVLKSNARSRSRNIIDFRDGRPMVLGNNKGKGNFYLSLAPIDPKQNDLVKHAEIYVPMIYKMALSGTISEKLSYTIGKDQKVEVNRQVQNSEIPYKIRGVKEFIPSMRNVGSVIHLNLGDMVEEDGIYDLLHDENLTRKLAFNYDRLESDPSRLTEEQILEKLGPKTSLLDAESSSAKLKERIIAKDKGIILWKWFIILALVFLALEIILIRLIRI